MPFYAGFDHTQPEPIPVSGWYDTDLIDYPNLPAADDLLEMTPEQWADRMTGSWAIEGGALVPYTPPPPVLTLPQQATAMLSQPVTVDCISTPALSSDYANNANVRQSVTSTVSQISAGLGLPGGGATFNWPDVNGSEMQWPEADFVAFAKALTDFAYACQMVVGGHSAVLPSRTLTVDVAALQGRK
jgi:hypothetical protein